MNIKTILISCVLLCVLFINPLNAASQNPIKTGETANWIINRSISMPASIPVDTIEGGVYYVLTDNQVRVFEGKQPVFFTHFAEMAVNQEGLKSISQINIEYDPSYESLVFNSIFIHRDGKLIDKLPAARMSLIQRETDLENQLYDGTLTANIILDDVRVGDIVEYSYTLEGANPVYGNIFAYERQVDWSVPVHKQRIRVLWGKSKPLVATAVNTNVKISERQSGSIKEYSVAIDDSKPLSINSEIPRWYRPHGMVFFSETSSWSDIAQWALALYKNAIETGPQITAIVDGIRARHKDPAQQIIEALKFVQSDIRYLGIEMGANSHKPSSANDTLQRRYGDCKDKAVLLISMLKLLGVEAWPALVNTEIRQAVSSYPPAIDAFNHVLVKVSYGNEVFWLDPTRQYQQGRLVDLYLPDYGYALVVDQATDDLVKMLDRPGYSKLVINDRFDLTKGGNQDVIYDSSTEYFGYQAERLRYQMADSGLAGLQDSYQEFYSRYYTAVEPLMKLSIVEDKTTGTMLQKEKYLLKKFWEINNEDKEYDGTFYANAIISYLARPKELNRNSPYEIRYPVNIRQNIDVVFGTNSWYFDAEEVIEDNKFFLFKFNAKYNRSSRTLSLVYDYQSRKDHVTVEEFDDYLAARIRARDIAEYGVAEYFKNDTPAQDEEGGDITSRIVNVVFITYAVVMLFIFINWRLDARKQPSFDDAIFYPVSLVKLFILSVASFGIYPVYWFYRNWLYRKQKDGSSIMPVARGIFNLFWYYPFYKSLVADSAERFKENRVLIRSLAILFAVLYLLANLLEGEDYLWMPALVILPLLLFPLANYINHINEGEQSAFNYNSRWLIRHSMLVILAVPVIVLAAGSDLYIFPANKVVEGDRIMEHDVKFMQRKGVFPASEKIIYFYSDGFLSVRDDGNGFTDNHVFSYWKEDDSFNYESEPFTNIQKIDVTFSKNMDENTVVTLVRDDGSDFIIFVSREEGLDKKFVKELKSRWNKARNISSP